MAKQIIWTDLPKKYALFTRRSTMMVDLRTRKVVQHYAANVKINLVQEATFEGIRFFRTNSAKERGLDWAFKASSFTLPESEFASLAPSEHSLSDINLSTFNTPISKQKVSDASGKPSKSEEKASPHKSLWKRISQRFRRKR